MYKEIHKSDNYPKDGQHGTTRCCIGWGGCSIMSRMAGLRSIHRSFTVKVKVFMLIVLKWPTFMLGFSLKALRTKGLGGVLM